jgi:major vault protein
LVSNPIVRNSSGTVLVDSHGNYKLRHGDEEVRFAQDPFPLYPGEKVVGKISPLQVVGPDSALRLRALRDFTQEDGTARKAGEIWMFPGQATYIPRIEVQVVEVVKATILRENQALRIRARQDCKDFNNVERKVGEEWLIRHSGAYLPLVDEEIVQTVSARVLTPLKALHLRASRTFVDVFGKTRKAGQEWLITLQDSETHIPDVNEEIVGEVKVTTLNNRQYCVVRDPWENGKQQFGKRQLRKGETSFFLQPGESLESGIQSVHVLGEEEALLLKSRESFLDETKVQRAPGDLWMIYGPCDYVPSVQVEIVEKRQAIPLDENEGIYVRDLKTGRVRAVHGESYMLKPNEELWAKPLPPSVEELIYKTSREAGGPKDVPKRDPTRVVTYRAPHNWAVQIYDYKQKKARVVFGPDLVMLGPDEHFTVLSLSGGKPKTSDQIKTIALFLGPDFMTDLVTVETSDHARLSLQLAYNWQFKPDDKDPHRMFQVPDFVGDACKAMASRVRGTVAGVPFDEFHKDSAVIIKRAVFGTNRETGQLRDSLVFEANNLIITNIDVQSVEPVDQRTRDALTKSVQLAIEITINSQKAAASHEALRLEQEAKGRLERQKINDESEAEKARRKLLELQAQSAAVESTGQATAEAKARADAAYIEGEAAVKGARLKADASKIKLESELEQIKNKQKAEIDHQKSLNGIEISREKELAEIEAQKFKNIVASLGADTIKSIAQAGPEMQAKLLQGLGLKSFLITDGNSPINLFNTASGLLGGPQAV